MAKQITRRFIVFPVIVLVLADACAFCLLLRSRYVSHLVSWSLRETTSPRDFDWAPGNAPQYYVPEQQFLLIDFRNEIIPVISDKSDDLDKALAIAHYVNTLFTNSRTGKRFIWGAPRDILSQANQGATEMHCFHRSILSSAYLWSVDIPTRLWAFEGTGFDGNAHTANEIYCSQLNKWIFIDPWFNCCVRNKEAFLSCLELRQSILSGNTRDLSFITLTGEPMPAPSELIAQYGLYMPCSFLRCRNDFASMFGNGKTYGYFSFLSGFLDRLPNSMRIGLSYLLAGTGVFVHFVDGYSSSLKWPAFFVRVGFYLLLALNAFLLALFLKRLGQRFRLL